MMFVIQEVLVHEVASQLLLRHFFFFFFEELGVSAEEENKITPIITNRWIHWKKSELTANSLQHDETFKDGFSFGNLYIYIYRPYQESNFLSFYQNPHILFWASVMYYFESVESRFRHDIPNPNIFAQVFNWIM